MRHERLVVAGGVAMLVLLSWWYVVGGAGFDAGMAEMGRPPFAALVVMWSLMMMAMMLPSAAPAVLLYARVREIRSRPRIVQNRGKTSLKTRASTWWVPGMPFAVGGPS